MTTGPGFFGEAPGADQPAEGGQDDPDSSAEEGTFADVLNGFTLNSGRGRRKRNKGGAGDEQQPPSHAAPEQGRPSSDAADQPAWPHTDDSRPASDVETFDAGRADQGGQHTAERDDQEPVPAADDTAVVRPYTLTGGRTKAKYPLELETLVSANADAAATASVAPEQAEQNSIVRQCQTPHSVAEIASSLRVPLGVARVLISDAADTGRVTVHKTLSGEEGDEAHLMLMERVLSGLRRL